MSVLDHSEIIREIEDWLGPHTLGRPAKDLLGRAKTLLAADQRTFKEYLVNLNNVLKANEELHTVQRMMAGEITGLKQKNDRLIAEQPAGGDLADLIRARDIALEGKRLAKADADRMSSSLVETKDELVDTRKILAGVRDDLIMSRDRSASLNQQITEVKDKNKALVETLEGSDKIATDALKQRDEAHHRLAACAKARDEFERRWRETIDENYRKQKTIAQLEGLADTHRMEIGKLTSKITDMDAEAHRRILEKDRQAERIAWLDAKVTALDTELGQKRELASVQDKRIDSLKAEVDKLESTTTLVSRSHHDKTVADLKALIEAHRTDCEDWARAADKLAKDIRG